MIQANARSGENVLGDCGFPELWPLISRNFNRCRGSFVDDLKEDVRRVRAIAEIADFVDHEDRRMDVERQDVAEEKAGL